MRDCSNYLWNSLVVPLLLKEVESETHRLARLTTNNLRANARYRRVLTQTGVNNHFEIDAEPKAEIGRHRAVETPKPKRKILVVDDERLIADTLAQILNMMGYDAVSVYSGTEAIERAATTPFDMLISDVMMPGMNGIESAIAICKRTPDCKVLLISGNSRTSEVLKEAEGRGHMFDILAKPIHPSIILNCLKATWLPK
jgi:CheY-like chemotaxis protein